ASLDHGVPQPLFPTPENSWMMMFWCTNAAANFCAYAALAQGGQQFVITAFDPSGGKRTELLRLPVEPQSYIWSLSFDGSRAALLTRDGSSNQIRFVLTHGGETRTAQIKGYSNFQSLRWAPDSRSVLVGAFAAGFNQLLRVDLNGNVQSIWQQPAYRY